MQLFYTPDLSGDHHALNEEESRHCLRVLRLRPGDIIHLTDGKGNLWEALITGDNPRQCTVQLTNNLTQIVHRPSPIVHRPSLYGFRPYHLHIAIAPTKNIDRFEWFLEKATEIGVDEITPLICEHSERRHLRIDRSEKVITAAMKQSLKAWHPTLHEPVLFDDFIKKPVKGDRFIAYITDDAPQFAEIYIKSHDAVCLIGPEGDFSHSEVEKATGAGYQVISLGNSRLRTETAGMAVCHSVYLMNMVR